MFTCSLYERAIAAAGTDFRSDKLWDSYVDWEKENNHLVGITAIYDRILTIPTQLYSHHFEKYVRQCLSFCVLSISYQIRTMQLISLWHYQS